MSAPPRGSIDFEEPASVRKFSRIISFAIVGGAAAFAAVVASTIPAAPPAEAPAEHRLYLPAVIVAFAVVLVATLIGVRMHGFQGTREERARKTLVAHVISLALCEAAALLGLVVVLVAKSWDAILPAALGFAGLATVAIRGEIRMSRLVEDAGSQASDR
jgi:hypothetical protein